MTPWDIQKQQIALAKGLQNTVRDVKTQNMRQQQAATNALKTQKAMQDTINYKKQNPVASKMVSIAPAAPSTAKERQARLTQQEFNRNKDFRHSTVITTRTI